MESSKLRAWAIGALYLIIALAGSLIASAPQIPFLQPYIPALSTVVTVGAVLRAFIDRTMATVTGAGGNRGAEAMEAVRAMPGVAEAIARGVDLATPPLPAGPTQLHDLADAIPLARRNFGPVGTPADEASLEGLPLASANPFSQKDSEGRYQLDNAAALARAQEQARSAEQARVAAAAARQAEIDRELAAQERRKQDEIQELEAKLSALRGGNS